MNLTVELTTETEQAITRKAQRLGITPSEYIRRMADRAARPTKPRNARPTTQRPKTCAEVLAELKALDMPKGYGDPAIDSPELARQLSAQFSRPDRSYLKAAQ